MDERAPGGLEVACAEYPNDEILRDALQNKPQPEVEPERKPFAVQALRTMVGVLAIGGVFHLTRTKPKLVGITEQVMTLPIIRVGATRPTFEGTVIDSVRGPLRGVDIAVMGLPCYSQTDHFGHFEINCPQVDRLTQPPRGMLVYEGRFWGEISLNKTAPMSYTLHAGDSTRGPWVTSVVNLLP